MRVVCGICHNESEQVDRAIGALEAEIERLRERHEDALTTLQETAKAAIRAEDRTRALVEFLEDVMSGERILPYQERKWEELRAALTEPTPPAGRS